MDTRTKNNHSKDGGRLKLLLALAALLILMPQLVLAQSTVHFAGFAYTGAYQDIAKSFPLTYAIDVKSSAGVSVLDQELRTRIAGHTYKDFNLDFEGLGNTHTGDDVALAFGLNRENVSVEHLAGVFKIVVTIDAQVLFFDMKQQQIVASYPFGLDYIDTTSEQPTQDYEQSLVRKLYFGGVAVNIFDEFAKALSSVGLRQHYGHTLQVTSVSIDDRAKGYIPPNVQGDLPALQSLIATEFSEYLAKNIGVPVLPYMKDYAIGNKMAARFANGDVYNLKVPDPDYAITLDLLSLKKIKYDQESDGTSWIYGAFIQLRAFEPLSNHVYMDAMIKQGDTKIVPASQTLVDDWAAFQVTIQGLMQGLTETLATPDSQWVHSHMGAADSYTQLEELKKVVESCK